MTGLKSTERAVAAHYSRRGDLAPKLLAVAADLYGSLDGLTAEDLAPLDQFHVRGHHATAEFAAHLTPPAGSRVLDLGCGIGGPARHLAATCDVEVVGVDLTESFCRDAAALSRAVGLQDRSGFVCGDATRLPFAEASFPLVWTQHAAMNVSDKAALYREAARVLVPGGRLALYDIMAGPSPDPHFPTPWAGSAASSFLLPQAEVKALIQAAGLRPLEWTDLTEDSVAWAKRRQAAAEAAREEGAAAAPGPHLVMGPEFPTMAANLTRNLLEGRVTVVRAVFDKPA